jgi:hypothetical protein
MSTGTECAGETAASASGDALTFDYAQAAEKLGPLVSERWLRRNIARVPHRRAGRRVAFTAADLEAITAQLSVAPKKPVKADIHGLGDLSDLIPSKALRQRLA